MHAFTYHRPKTLQEAAQLFAKSSDARYLAGGQTLLPALRMRLSAPEDLIDLGAIGELSGIKVNSNVVTIGAMTSHNAVADSKDVRKAIPALALLAAGIGDRQVRNCGTIGGSVANSDPAACYPAGVLGLGATITTNKRAIAADQFFTGLYETALEAGELITSIAFPAAKRAAYVKFENPASRFAIVGVFVSQTDGGVRCAVTGAGACAFRVAAIEQALTKNFSPAALDNVKVPATGLNADIHASAEYRAHLITVLAKRAAEAAAKG
jgi:aerobic carbon-monoxide dehydrogenase medium subunit